MALNKVCLMEKHPNPISDTFHKWSLFYRAAKRWNGLHTKKSHLLSLRFHDVQFPFCFISLYLVIF